MVMGMLKTHVEDDDDDDVGGIKVQLCISWQKNGWWTMYEKKIPSESTDTTEGCFFIWTLNMFMIAYTLRQREEKKNKMNVKWVQGTKWKRGIMGSQVFDKEAVSYHPYLWAWIIK
jgi:hypothetical protein